MAILILFPFVLLIVGAFYLNIKLYWLTKEPHISMIMLGFAAGVLILGLMHGTRIASVSGGGWAAAYFMFYSTLSSVGLFIVSGITAAIAIKNNNK